MTKSGVKFHMTCVPERISISGNGEVATHRDHEVVESGLEQPSKFVLSRFKDSSEPLVLARAVLDESNSYRGESSVMRAGTSGQQDGTHLE